MNTLSYFAASQKTWKLIDAGEKLYIQFEHNAYSDVIEIPIAAMILDVFAHAAREHYQQTEGRDCAATPLWRQPRKETQEV